MPVEILPVESKGQLRAFLDLPKKIYRGDANWVEPLRREVSTKLDRRRNPFFEHGQAEYFIACNGRETVGRIAAIRDDLHPSTHGEAVGYFGFFECADDKRVAGALFEAAARWMGRAGLKIMRGPINFTMNEECGVLLEPFDQPAMLLMQYNPPYYGDLIEAAGFSKAKDLFAYQADASVILSARIVELAEVVRARLPVRIRPFDLKYARRDVALISDMYNSAWASHWGFIPMTEREVDAMARDLLRIADPALVLFAELEGKPIGFILLVPDWNQAIRYAHGRLLPFGWLRVLRQSRRIDAVRALAFGVLPGYRKHGVDLLLGYEAYRIGLAKGYTRVEMSWIPEDLTAHLAALEHIGARLTKRYRIYDKPLDRAAVRRVPRLFDPCSG